MGLVHFLFSDTGDIKFERISIGQGLSQSTVYCILQDSRGFMWFGTHDGLNKFGVLWIGTRDQGLNQLDREKETFTWKGISKILFVK
jgi:ligand-binding sensor domain-containing protein